MRGSSLAVMLSMLSILGSSACVTAPEAKPAPEPEPVVAAPTPAASLTLTNSAQPLTLGQGLELLTCEWDRQAERGDYVWIRLATKAESKGNGGPHLDLDVCRLTDGSDGYTVMPPGQHGSRCRAEPGFAIWWHDSEAAFVSPIAGHTPATPCELELVREADDWLSGEFACDPLYAVTDASVGPGVLEGSFRCLLEPAPPPPPPEEE
jgi:hypothetical protein